VGEDAQVKGLWHSAGHEGAGIGLAPGSAALITDEILGRPSFMDASAFSPARFAMAKV
jgi:glycine/D-amino acid oxidase-like deaminating enzyme